MIQVCVEASMKYALHVSPPSRSVNPMNRRNNNEEVWQLRQKIIVIAKKLYAKPITYDVDVECATQNRRHL
jgi:hypothetical protein